MTLNLIDYSIIIIFFLLLVVFAYRQRKTTSFSDFAIADKGFGTGLLTTSLIATIIGPGFSIAVIGQGYSSGFYFLVAALAYGLGYIMFGLFVSPKLAELKNTYSVGDIMETKYGKYGKILTGIFSFGLLSGFVAIMAKVGGGILSTMVGIPFGLAAIIVVGVVVLYTYLGGMKASVHTDAYQTIVFGSALVILFITALVNSSVGITESLSAGVSVGLETIGAMPFWALIGLMFSMMFGEIFLPPMVARALSAKSAEVSKKTFLVTGALVPLILGMFLLTGIFAGGILPSGTSQDGIAITLVNSILGTGFLGFFLIAFLSIIMSSLDSILQSGAVVASNDIFFWRKHKLEKELTGSKISIVIMGVLGIVLALFIPDLISTLLILYAIWVPVIMIPFLYAVFSKRVTDVAGIISMFAGGMAAYVWEYVMQSPGGFPGIIFGTIISLAAIEAVILIKGKSVEQVTV